MVLPEIVQSMDTGGVLNQEITETIDIDIDIDATPNKKRGRPKGSETAESITENNKPTRLKPGRPPS